MFREDQDDWLGPDDRYVTANEQAKEAVDRSRAKVIGDLIYPNINEEAFASFFSDDKASKPNTPIRKYVSALITERIYGIHDDVFLEMLRSGSLSLQYALHTTGKDRQPLSERSFNRFRSNVLNYNREHHCDLIRDEFKRITLTLGQHMGHFFQDQDDQDASEEKTKEILYRMDSIEIEARAKVMPRLEILYTSVFIVLRCMVRLDLKALIPKELQHYLEKDDHNKALYYKGPADKRAEVQDNRVASTVSEMDHLYKLLDADIAEVVRSEPEYQVFARVLKEQTWVDDKGERHPLDKKDIAPDSVQNPFDVTETYRNKRGPHHGYVANITECVDGKGNGLIVDAQIEPNTASDNKMAEDFVKNVPDDGVKRKVSVDGAYAGEELDELAKKKNVEFVRTSLTGSEPDEKLADFELNSDKTAVLKCPNGIIPEKCIYNAKTGQIRAHLPAGSCDNCPYKKLCFTPSILKAAAKKNKSLHIVVITAKKIERAKTVRSFGTDEAKANARIRNGVEGIMSVLRRKYGIDSIPVFGIERSSIWIWTSLIAYNIRKYMKYQQFLKRETA